MNKDEIRRQEATYELIQSEENYVQDLELVVRVRSPLPLRPARSPTLTAAARSIAPHQLFLKPMRTLELLTTTELTTVFGNVEDVLAVNKAFLTALQARQHDGGSNVVDSVADIVAEKVRRAPPPASPMFASLPTQPHTGAGPVCRRARPNRSCRCTGPTAATSATAAS